MDNEFNLNYDKELSRRFDFKASSRTENAESHEKVRQSVKDTAKVFFETVPFNVERVTAIEKLEEAMFWANAAIARSVDE